MEAAYRPGIESGRSDDDDEEAIGADGSRRKKRKEGPYHRLDEAPQGGFGELWQRNQAEHHGIFGNLFEKPDESKKDDEDEEDEDEKKDAKKSRETREHEQTTDTHPEAAQDIEIPLREPPPPSEHAQASSEHKEPEKPASATQRKPARSDATPAAEKRFQRQEDYDEEFARLMHQSADKDYQRAVSGDILTPQQPGSEAPAIENTDNKDVSLEPEPTHPASQYDAAHDRRSAGYNAGPGGQPAEASPEPSAGAGFEGPSIPPAPGTIPSRPFERPGGGTDTRRLERAETRGKRLRNAVMVLAIVGYFANKHRKQENRQQDKEIRQLKQHQQAAAERAAADQQALHQHITEQGEQTARQQAVYEAQRRAAASENRPLQAPEYTPPATPSEASRPPAAAAPGAEAVRPQSEPAEDPEAAARHAVEEARKAEEAAAADPHRHIERDAWRRYVVDDQGHEVKNVIQYGAEYTHEREQEVLTDRSATGTSRANAVSPEQHQGAMAGGLSAPRRSQQASRSPGNHSLENGQVPPDHSLPAGMPTPADWQHQLPEKSRSPLIAALTSPWLFLMLSLILLAYFIASLL